MADAKISALNALTTAPAGAYVTGLEQIGLNKKGKTSGTLNSVIGKVNGVAINELNKINGMQL